MDARVIAAAIVPAHNEEKTVGDVVRTLVSSGLFREVIVVSDGSTDGTAAVAKSAGATLVHELPERRGKGAALSHGVMHTDAPFVCFFDADLKGLTAAHVAAVLAPVASGKAYMHVGVCDRGPFVNALVRRLPAMGGQRALRREVFDMIPGRYVAGYKAETALNFYCDVNRLPRSRSLLAGLGVVTKAQKIGMLRAVGQYARMWAQVAFAASEVRLARHRFEEHGTHMSHWHR